MIGDPRDVSEGRPVPTLGYCDQPYIVVNDDGSWLCLLTTSPTIEGDPGIFSVALRSSDQGRTWSDIVALEPLTGPEAGFAVPIKTPSGRIYAFYCYNADNLREVKADDPPFAGGRLARVDTLGHYVYRYTDDGGRTWSDRHELPVREMRIDRENPYGGAVRFFWGVSKPIVHQGSVLIPFAKVGRYGDGMYAESQCCLMRSDNLLEETDPARIEWLTLPDGDQGLVAPEGAVCEEPCLVPLADGRLYCTFRTVAGSPGEAYSDDLGRTWSPTRFALMHDGRRVKHPRAATFVWKTQAGEYLRWGHNHGDRDYESRNPAWIYAGIERDGELRWSEPEIALYDEGLAWVSDPAPDVRKADGFIRAAGGMSALRRHPDGDRGPGTRLSYPDFVEHGGRAFLTATNKETPRVHPVEHRLLDGLWRQGSAREVARDGLALEHEGGPAELELPTLPRIADGHGLSLEFQLRFAGLDPWQVLFDSRGADGRGILVWLTDRATIKASFCGTLAAPPGGVGQTGAGITESAWECDRGLLEAGAAHHVTIVLDGGPKLLLFVVDGRLCDGGAERRYGWSRFNRYLRDVNGARTAHLGEVSAFRLYTRALTTSEVLANRRAVIEAVTP